MKNVLILFLYLTLTFLPIISYSENITVLQSTLAAGIIEKKPSLVGDVFLNNVNQLHFFTKVKSTEWNESQESYITHVWYYKNEQVSLIKLKIGGSIWRTYSTKSIPRSALGEWRVEALDKDGNILKAEAFNITEQGS